MHNLEHLQYILVILAAAILFVLVFQRLHISPVLGYLVAGVAVGPFGGALIQDSTIIHLLGEFGVIFLLFSIGLELPFQRLLSMRWHIFGLGLAQVSTASLVIGFIAYGFGLSPEISLVVGGALALSSTATVLQLLIEREEIAAKFGRVSVAVLLFQDLAVVPLLVLIPLLATPDTHLVTALATAAVKGFGSLIAVVLIGRLIFRPLYSTMATARNTEIFTATTLFIVLCAGFITAKGGMSMALGAFLAGMLLAETRYRHQIEADIHPFRGLFLGLFFMTVGMSINIGIILSSLWWIMGITLGLLTIKMVIVTLLCKIARLRTATAAHVGMMLSQGSEFGFVILGLAIQQQVMPEAIGNILMVAIAFTLLAAPLLATLGKTISRNIDHKNSFKPETIAAESNDLSHHVIIAGYGRMGNIISKLLSTYHIPYVVLDNDVHCVQAATTSHSPVYFGDARRLEALQSVGIERASAIVIAVNSPHDIEHMVGLVHEHYPELEILVRSHDQHQKKLLEAMGATTVIPEIIEPSLQLGAIILERIGVPPKEIERTLSAYRKDNYAFLEE